MKHTSKHPGFQAEAAAIASREGVTVKEAGAILAAGARRASKQATARNPRLLRVKRGKRK
jgi:hypothetical protein